MQAKRNIFLRHCQNIELRSINPFSRLYALRHLLP